MCGVSLLPTLGLGMTGTSQNNIKYSGAIFLRLWRVLKCIAHKPDAERARENASKKSLDNRAQKTRHFSRRKSAAKTTRQT